jgi:hydroxymethylbilane synthase
MTRSLVIGSRGSKLALWQAEHARNQLRLLNPDLEIRIEIIKTTGDVKRDPLAVIGGKGVFTKELEDALLSQRIDVAVHSLKDLPTVVPDALALTAICEREDPRDALVLRGTHENRNASVRNLPSRAVVGTSSLRRMAQLKSVRPDIEIKDLRGNIDTRLRKLDEGQYDALILASAGLRRLGLHERIISISTDDMLPAVGQGAVGIETRRDDHFTNSAVAKLEHHETRLACLAERSLLRELGGGCQFPIAAHAILEQGTMKLEALVAKPDGSQILRDHISGPANAGEELGKKLAQKLIEHGANSLLNE